MVALRRVGPRKAWDPGSSAPPYASTSVMRTATSPCRSTEPSSRGAASRADPASTSRSSAEPGTVLVDDGGDLAELLADPPGSGAAASLPGRNRPLDREDLADSRGERRCDV